MKFLVCTQQEWAVFRIIYFIYRNLVYHILDQLLENLFPEVTTFDLIHDLLFSSLSSTLTMPRLVKEAEKL